MDTVTENKATQQPASTELAGLPRLLSIKQVASLTTYAPGTIYHMIRQGVLASVKRGTKKQSRVYIPEESYLAWFKGLTPRNPVKTRNYNRRRKAA